MRRLWRLPALSSILSLLLLFADGSATFAQTADFTASPLSGCAPLVVSFTDASSGTINTYNWNLGNGATPAIPGPSTIYTSPGSYTVSLTVTGPGGSNTMTKTAYITIYSKPTVTFAATTPTSGCTPLTLQFGSTVVPNAPGTAIYNWDFGDGYSGTGANPSHTYITAGTYPVSLTVTNGAGCDTTVVRSNYITAFPKPSGGFSANQNAFCSAPATVNFTNTSVGGVSPYTTYWQFGDGGTGTGTTISHTYNTGGTFTVTMIVTDSRGCVDTVINPAYITVVGILPAFTAPAAVCVESAASFVNTTTGGGIANWDFDDGTSATGNNVSHSYLSSGTYSVQMSVVIGGCTKTVSQTIIVNPKPIPTIMMSPPIPCPKPVTITFTGSTSGAAATNYAWSWRNGGTATGQTVTKNYLPNFRSRKAEEDTVKLITTSAAGCQDSVESDTVRVRNIFVAIYSAENGCLNVPFYFSTALFTSVPSFPPIPPYGIPYPLPEISWSWDFGDGSPGSSLATPSHGYSLAGDYTVRCIITTPNGCTDTGYTRVHTDTPVHPSFTASPLAVCPRAPVTFINTTAVNLVGTYFVWGIGDDTTIGKQDTSRVITGIKRPGTYTIRLVSDHRGCIDTFYRINYIVVYPPGARFTDSVYCSPPTTVKFINTSIGATSQLWDFGDGTTSTLFNPTHIFPALDTYNVMLVVYNSTYGCTDTFRHQYILFKPFIDFAVSDSAICTNDFVHFQAAFTGSGAVHYSWLFDTYRTPFDTASAIDYQYTTRGYHDVTLYTSSSNGCSDSLKKARIILVSRPSVSFVAIPPIGCEPLPVQFVDHSGNAPGVRDTFFSWSFGDGVVLAAGATTNHTYPVRGSYTVTLLVVDSLGCADSLIRSNYVSVHKPRAIFTVNRDSVCTHAPVNFTSTSTGTKPLKHRWDFGDATSDTGYFPTHRYANAGLYTVRLIVTDTVGCSDTFTLGRRIYVDGPHASFTSSDSIAICPPLQVTFTNTSTGATNTTIPYIWDFGSGTPVIATNPIHTFKDSGLYNIYLVAINANNCTDTARAVVRVLGYDGAFTYSPLAGCAPMSVTFTTPINGIPFITWDFGDGVTTPPGTATTTSHIYLSDGPYLPKVIFSDGHGCTSSSTGVDTIKADKLKADFRWSVPCVGAPFTLSDSSSARYNNPVAWTWNFGGGDTAHGSPVSHIFATSGLHPVTLIATNATGCRDTITRQVLINNLPTIDATNDTGVCPGDKATLTVRGGVAYVWGLAAPDSLGNCPVCDTAYVHLSSPNSGDYEVYRVTGVDANGCVNKDSLKVIIQLKTTASTGAGGEICVGESFRLHADGAQSYVWMPAATLDSPLIASPLATPEQTTTYIVAAREGTCAVDSQQVRVVVHSLPLFSAGPDMMIALGSAATLEPTQSGITRIAWRADTSLSCLDCFRPVAHPYYTTVYYATGYNEYGCGATDSVMVHVRCNGSLVYIPNTFTPNGDGLNDYFFPRGKGIDRMSSFRVYNRWGEVVYERSNVFLNDERAGWDGTFKGRALPPDVYVYTMQSRCSTGEVLNWKGDVTILK